MTVLTPNEKLTGTTAQKREILNRLTRFRTDPERSLRLAEKYPHLTFTTMDEAVAGLSETDAEVFTVGLELARDRFAEFGEGEMIPHERVFVAVGATVPVRGGFHHRLLPERQMDDTQSPGYRYVQAAAVISRYGDLFDDEPSAPGLTGLDLVRAYVHDCHHYLTFRSYRLGATGIHRNQHGINFRRESGSTYSARDPEGSPTTRNLGVVMEGAFDREATAVARLVAARCGIECPPDGIDFYTFRNATGDSLTALNDDPWLRSMNGYTRAVTKPYTAFLLEVGGPDADELHTMILSATLSGELGKLQGWLDERYGPGEFTALFRSGAYAA
jgi:hypothetical protein